MAGCSHGAVSLNWSVGRRARTFMEANKMPGRDSAYSSDGESDLAAASTSRTIAPQLSTRRSQLKRTRSLHDRRSTSTLERSVPDIRRRNNKSINCTSSIIREKMRSMKETIRKHAVQSLTNGGDWPPPQTIFGDRYFSTPSIGTTRLADFDKPSHTKRSSVSNSSLSGIVVSDSDLRAIICSVKKHVANSMNVKSADDVKSKNANFFPPKRIIRKQVSFDDKELVFVPDLRKVSIIQEEIDGSGLQSLVTNSESALNSSLKFVSNLQKFKRLQLPSTSTTSNTDNDANQQLSSFDSTSNVIEQNFVDICDDVVVEPSEICNEEAPLSNDHTHIKDNSTNLTSGLEIEYDEYGQTWDIYGAEIDPVILGDAIERHLHASFQTQSEHLSVEFLSKEKMENDTQLLTERKRLPYFLRWCVCRSERHNEEDCEMINLRSQNVSTRQKCAC